jgi:hypothetical protein
MASGAIPPLGEIEPKPFAKLLSDSEIALGAALLLPIVPSVVAGAALTAFGAGLITLYWRTPGLREPGSARWTQAGTGIAKDVWLLGAGLTLLLDSVRSRKR